MAELSGVNVDPYKSPICLGCHTTAYDVETWERDNSFHFEDGVQCELCHGTGCEYIDAGIMRNRETAMQAGLILPGERECLVCHKEKGSHTAVLPVKIFDYKKVLQEIAHPGIGGPLPLKNEPPVAPSSGSKYVGVIACGDCHGEASAGREYSKWRCSKHARAYAILSAERAQEIAREIGVSSNPQKSDKCLKCHTTAAGEPAGRFSDSFDSVQGVHCESCHGPGSKYMDKAVMPDVVAAAKAGLNKVNKKTCKNCHTKDIHGHTFNFETMWPKIDHSKWEEENTRVEYKTTCNLAVTRDGKRLFTACEASNSLIVLNTKTGNILTEVGIGTQPHFICFSPDEIRAYVSNRGSDNVSVIDTKTYSVVSTIAVGDEPHEMATNKEGTILYVANAGTYDVSVVDPEKSLM